MKTASKLALAAALLMALVAPGRAEDKPTPEQLQAQLERMSEYANLLKGDRDQKEAALSDLRLYAKRLEAEIARLRAAEKKPAQAK